MPLQRTGSDPNSGRWGLTALLIAVVFLFAGCAGTAPWQTADKPKNIIILFGDGAAATQWEFGRYTSEKLRKQPFAITDVVFKQGSFGLMTTYSADSVVTDSAAAASAMATGYKTKTGGIGITADGRPVETVMEIAKKRGKRIGLVTTAAVHDASPAAFAAHANSRRESQNIVDQYLAFEPDVLMGGGRDYFLPKEQTGGKRTDGKNIIEAFTSKGYQVVTTTEALKSAHGPRLLALFADEDMDFEIDRDARQEPSTADMAAAAIRVLSQNSPNGFVLFLENENTDTAGHQNDAAALMRDLWALDDAVKVALDYQKRNPDTLVIVTGDHETGGLSWTYAQKVPTTSSRDRFYPGTAELELLNGIKGSFTKAGELIGTKPAPDLLDRVLLKLFPGFTMDADLRTLFAKQQVLDRNAFYMPYALYGRMVARQTGIYWGTSGHTPEPVVVGAHGPGASRFRGYMDNTDFARILGELLGAR